MWHISFITSHHIFPWSLISGIAWVSGAHSRKWNWCPLSRSFPGNVKNVDQKQISVIFQGDKRKKKKKGVLSSFSSCAYMYKAIIQILQGWINNSELLSDLWPICTKWLVYFFLYRDDFNTPTLKWPLGVLPFPPSYVIDLDTFCFISNNFSFLR